MSIAPLPSIPPSTSTVSVSIIDTSFRISSLSTSIFLGPELEGFDKFDLRTYAFLITHSDTQTGKRTKILFDLGPPKDWEHDLAPTLVERIGGWGAKIEIEKNVSEILEENGVPLDSIDAVVWSHPHWDHIGRPSLFPPTTTLITGPGVKAAFYPGYPENASSPILSREFAGRTVRELDFSTSDLVIGGFQAIDFFGDGSLYFLSAPGHAVGHMVALARTTAAAVAVAGTDSTFLLMAADSYHHPSQLRPHRHLPLPDNTTTTTPYHRIHPSSPTHQPPTPTHYTSCILTHHSDPQSTPFFTISQTPNGASVATDIEQARATIRALHAFDADPNVFLIAAHDESLAGVVEYFPALANVWMKKGWKELGRWAFLDELKGALKRAGGGSE